MASKRTGLTAQDFDQLYQKLVKLGVIQKQLREATLSTMKEGDLTTSSFAALLGVQWAEVKALLEKKRAVCGGKFLQQLIIVLERPDLQTEIDFVMQGLKDWQCGAALFPPEIIRLTVDVQKMYVLNFPHVTYELFTELFDPYQEIAMGVLKFSLEALSKLSDQTTAQLFFNVLDDEQGMREKLTSLKELQTKRINEKVRELEKLLAELRPRYTFIQDVAAGLGISRSTFQYARRGLSSEKTMDDILTHARDLLAQPSEWSKQDTTHGPLKREDIGLPAGIEDSAHTQKLPLDSEVLSQNKRGDRHVANPLEVAGETTSDGVRYALTSASFRDLELDHIEEWLMSTKKALERARFMLNIGTQLVHGQHEAVREVLEAEIRELYLSIEAFSKEHPNEITPLIDAQRNTFLARKNANVRVR